MNTMDRIEKNENKHEFHKIGMTGEIFRQMGLEEYLEDEILFKNVGYDGKIYILASKRSKEVDARFDTIVLVLGLDWDSGEILSADVLRMKDAHTYWEAEPFGDDILLYIAGSEKDSETGEPDNNAAVYSKEGNFIKGFFTGDHGSPMFTTKDRRVIVGYDELGIWGFDESDILLGRSGLVVWDENGNKIWDNHEDMDILDMYAMNIDDEGNIWYHPYSTFGLKKLDKDYKKTHINLDIKGCKEIIIPASNKGVIVDGGYNHNKEHYKYDIVDGCLKNKRRIRFICDDVEIDPYIIRSYGSLAMIEDRGGNLYCSRF